MYHECKKCGFMETSLKVGDDESPLMGIQYSHGGDDE